MTRQDSHRPGVGQLTDAYRQHRLSPEEVCEQLFEPVDDARLNCNAAEQPRA